MARPIGPRRVPRYPDEFKLQAVKLSSVAGVKVGDVAEALGIHPWMLSKWRTQASKGLIKARTSMPVELRAPKAREMDAYARLKKSHALLKEEHEILKKFIWFSSEQKRTDSNS
jgi:transposase